MKKYIMFEANPFYLGGQELYTSSKGVFLKENGYDVYVISPAESFGKYKIKTFQELNVLSNTVFKYEPSFFNEFELEQIKQVIYTYIKYNGNDTIYIESQDDVSAPWGEIVAEWTHGKHICFLLHESYSFPGSRYKKYMELYKFKFLRNELYARVDILFNDKKLDYHKWDWDAEEGEVVQDTECTIKNIKKADQNIMYVGRIIKPFVYNIVKGMEEYALNNSDKEIQYIFVGDISERADLICRRLLHLNNVKVFVTGELIPIPRQIYKNADVVIAGARSAIYSALEGVPVIVADCGNYLSNGVLGYTCDLDECFHHKEGCKQMNFSEAIDEVLNKKSYLENKFSLHVIHDYKESYKKQEKIFLSDVKQEYFDVKNVESDDVSIKKSSLYKIEDLRCRTRVNNNIKSLVNNVKKLVIYSAGEYCIKCMGMLRKINVFPEYVIDSNDFKWNTEVQGAMVYSPEKIKTDKDKIVLLIPDPRYEKEIIANIKRLAGEEYNSYLTYKEMENSPRILE